MKLVRREELPSSYKPLKSFFTTYVWAIDGWTYNTIEKKRMRYFKNMDNILMEEQALNTFSIPQCLHKEELQIHILSYKPFMWIEEGVDFKELYVSLDIEKM